MNRRESLRAIGLGTLTTGLLLEGCKTKEEKKAEEIPQPQPTAPEPGRQDWEAQRDKALLEQPAFFTAHEMAAITLLADMIIPKDDVSGSASDAKVPQFIDFIAKDMPEHQLPLRGGLRWLDVQCLNRYNAAFADCNPQQRTEIVDLIAYPYKATPDVQQGVAFFNRMRDLTATGFFTTRIGFDDLDYKGNAPNRWTGVPADVLKQYGFKSDDI